MCERGYADESDAIWSCRRSIKLDKPSDELAEQKTYESRQGVIRDRAVETRLGLI